MIAHPPQQEIHLYHLGLSFVLLTLTVYPYLFNTNGHSWSVAAYSAEEFDLKHRHIERFDIIEVSDVVLSKSLSTRATTEQQLHETAAGNIQEQDKIEGLNDAIQTSNRQDEPIKKIHFSSLGRRFNLILSRPAHLISDDLTIVALDGNGKETKVPYDFKNMQVLDGFVDGLSNSTATASFNEQNKLMTAQIKTGSETIIVEPTYLHRENLYSTSAPNVTSAFNAMLYDKTMIVYNMSDHEQFKIGDNLNEPNRYAFDPDKLCIGLNMSEPTSNGFNAANIENEASDQDLDDVFKFYKKEKQQLGVRKLKRDIEFQSVPSRERTRCTLHLVADYLFYKHVGNGDLQTTINYLLALINRVNHIYLPTVWDTGDETETFKNIGFTVQNITIHQEYTRLSSGELHYNTQSDKVWGAREFLDNFSRYSPPRHYCLAHLLTYRQFDSPVLGLAYVASTRYGTIGGICSPMQQKGDAYYKHNTGISTSKGISGETLITRQADLVLAHELGHNLGAEHDSNECRPSSSNGGAFLMHPYAVMGFEKNNRFLSNCSRLSIGKVIRRKGPTCFVGVVDNVCGNGVVEGDEECDGGDVGLGHNDPCCDSSCRFTPGSQCSDRHSWCCSRCHIVHAGQPCRPAEEFNCKQASYCDGRSAECPAPPPAEDNQICVGRGLCRGGECVPFCEARELHSCLCTTTTDACKLCCKSSVNGTCVPYDIKAPYLPDGVLCFRGVCEKGRCEQPIQDVIERLWDVIEDINFTTLVKFLRDNIILVVLVLSIPIWCICTHYINEFDKRFKQDVVTAIMKHGRGRKAPISRSPFLPHLFVGDDSGGEDPQDDAQLPLKQPEPNKPGNGNRFYPPPHQPGFRPHGPGFRLPGGEEVVIEQGGSIALNSIELPHHQVGRNDINENRAEEREQIVLQPNSQNLYSTQV